MSEDETFDITYEGAARLSHFLVYELEEQGAKVQWDPPVEYKSFAADAHEAVVAIVASGSYKLIEVAVTRFLLDHPEVKIMYKPRHKK